MSSQTTNLHFVKPTGNENISRLDYNDNWDKTDDAYGEVVSQISKQVSQSNSLADCNAATTDGFYATSSSTANRPGTHTGVLMTKRRSSNEIIQKFFSVDGEHEFTRRSLDNGAIWSNWYSLSDNFIMDNYNTSASSPNTKTLAPLSMYILAARETQTGYRCLIVFVTTSATIYEYDVVKEANITITTNGLDVTVALTNGSIGLTLLKLSA